MGTIFNNISAMRNEFKNSLDSFFNQFLNFKNKMKNKKDYDKYIKKTGFNQFLKKLMDDYDYFSSWLENEFLWNFNPNFQEFKYDIIYINWFIKENREKILKHYYWHEIESYNIRGFFLFLYSLLDKITTVNYWTKKCNEPEFLKQVTSNNKKEKEKTLNLVRRIHFNKIEFNDYFKKIKNSTLWNIINLRKNEDIHWSAMHRTEDPNDMHLIKYDYTYFIYLTLFLFLWYLKEYALQDDIWGIK